METFGDTFVPGELGETWFAAHACPACAHPRLRHVVTAEPASHFVCEACGRCWEAVHGGLHRVDPVLCAGCATRGKPACMEVLQRDFPSFGPGSG